MKKRVVMLVLVLVVLSGIVYADLPQPPGAPPKPNINFPEDLVGNAAGATGGGGSGGGNTGDPYDPFSNRGGGSNRAANGTVPGTSDDWGLDGTAPTSPTSPNFPQNSPQTPRTTPSATQPRTPAIEPEAEEFSFWIIALIAGAGIILIVVIIVAVTYFMKSKTVPANLKNYIQYNTRMGYRMDALEPLLLNVGWSKEQIKKAYIEALGRNRTY